MEEFIYFFSGSYLVTTPRNMGIQKKKGKHTKLRSAPPNASFKYQFWNACIPIKNTSFTGTVNWEKTQGKKIKEGSTLKCKKVSSGNSLKEFMRKRASSRGFSPPLSSIQFSSRVSSKLNTFAEVYFINFLDVSHFLKENILLLIGYRPWGGYDYFLLLLWKSSIWLTN